MKATAFVVLSILLSAFCAAPMHAQNDEVAEVPTTGSSSTVSEFNLLDAPSSLQSVGISSDALPDSEDSSSRVNVFTTGQPAIIPGPLTEPPPPTAEGKVQWKSLMGSSLMYLGVMHSFRLATEAGTREGLHNSVVGGYFKALGAMHGWSDGDGLYENYLGHPIQGAVSGYIWIQHDPRYREVQFGKDRDYWMSRLRAYAFAWAFSEQFEVGPISEASIGQIQRYCCAYGFVDHIITPNGAMAWMLASDAIDRYITVPIENRTENVGLRILARIALNPTQSFANFMSFQYPWRRENRATVSEYRGEMFLRPSRSLEQAVDPADNPGGFNVVPKFEIAATLPSVYQTGGLSCLGGGGIGAFRAGDFWQWTAEVSGCTLGNSLPSNWSGDSLTFTFGPQWIVHTAGRWSPHAHFRVGGQKITTQYQRPKTDEQALPPMKSDGVKTGGFEAFTTQNYETTGLSMSIGGGLDIGLNRALAVRVANLDYTHSWLADLNGRNFDEGFRFTTGLVLRLGTW
jgi:hypothetical protein